MWLFAGVRMTSHSQMPRSEYNDPISFITPSAFTLRTSRGSQWGAGHARISRAMQITFAIMMTSPSLSIKSSVPHPPFPGNRKQSLPCL